MLYDCIISTSAYIVETGQKYYRIRKILFQSKLYLQ